MNIIKVILAENKLKEAQGEPHGPADYSKLSMDIREKYGVDISPEVLAGIGRSGRDTNARYAQMIAGAFGKPVEDVFPIKEKVAEG